MVDEPVSAVQRGVARASRATADSLVVANVLLMLVGVLGLVITARYLGVTDRGRYLTWSSWCALIGTLSMLGTEAFVVVAAASARARVSLWTLWSVLAAAMALAGALAFLAMAWIEPDPTVIAGGMLVAMSGPIIALHAHVQLANGYHNWRFNLSRTLAPLLGFASVVAGMTVFRLQAEGLFLLLGIGLCAGAIAAVALAWEPASAPPGFVRTWIALARRGAPLTLLIWLLLNVDTVAVATFGDSTDVGLYGVGVGARGAVAAVGSAVGLRWYAARGSLTSARAVARSFLPTVAVVVAVAIVAPLLVPLVLGAEFSPSVPTVQILGIAGLLASLDFLLGRVVLVRAGYGWPTLVRAVAVVVLVAGIGAVHGEPNGSALIYCLVVGGAILGQIGILSWSRVSRKSG